MVAIRVDDAEMAPTEGETLQTNIAEIMMDLEDVPTGDEEFRQGRERAT